MTGKTALVRKGLNALIERESARRLARLGGNRAEVESHHPATIRTRMILVDTSVWIDHLRSGDGGLTSLLNDNQAMIHPFVIGELACGNLNNRAEVLSRLRDLPMTPVAADPEVLFFIEQQRLMGRGIGYVDAHLLAAVALISSACLWTRDKQLRAVAASLELAYKAN